MRILRRLLILLLTCFALATAGAPTALAGGGATKRFHTAKKLFLAGDYDAALPEFRALVKETGSPNARLYVARCLQQLGRLADAYDQMHRTVRDAGSRAGEHAKYAATRDAAAAELALLEPQVGKLVINVPGALQDLEVRLDDDIVSSRKLGVPITVEPGSHTVTASARDRLKSEREVEVKGGKTLPVEVSLGELEPGGGGNERETGFFGPLRIGGVAVGALGVAGLAAFTVTAVMVKGKESTLADECGGRCTDPKYDDVIDSGKTLQTVANISLAVGGAALIAGVTMMLVGEPATEPVDAAEPQALIELGPGGATVGVKGRF